MTLRGSCQACGSVDGAALPGSPLVSGVMPSDATMTGPRYCADRVSRASQLSRPSPLTTSSCASPSSRAWSGLGSKTCASASGPTRLVDRDILAADLSDDVLEDAERDDHPDRRAAGRGIRARPRENEAQGRKQMADTAPEHVVSYHLSTLSE